MDKVRVDVKPSEHDISQNGFRLRLLKIDDQLPYVTLHIDNFVDENIDPADIAGKIDYSEHTIRLSEPVVIQRDSNSLRDPTRPASEYGIRANGRRFLLLIRDSGTRASAGTAILSSSDSSASLPSDEFYLVPSKRERIVSMSAFATNPLFHRILLAGSPCQDEPNSSQRRSATKIFNNGCRSVRPQLFQLGRLDRHNETCPGTNLRDCSSMAGHHLIRTKLDPRTLRSSIL